MYSIATRSILLRAVFIAAASLFCTVSAEIVQAETASKAIPIPAGLTKKKTWNFIVYMAANNNLHSFALKNLNQMMSVGSNDAVNIIAQIDGLQQKKIKRYYVKRGELVTLAENDSSDVLPSGTPTSLYNLVNWTVQNFPADHQAIVLWNHGSGIKDPSMWGRGINPNRDELFDLNEVTGKLFITRNADTTESLFENELKERGIAFNDAHRNYITNKELRETLEKIQTTSLGGKKISAVFFDACHMGMAELAHKMHKSVAFMAGSAEVEPGSGYNYASILRGCTPGISPKHFAQHVVKMYGQEYNQVYAELTQIALDLEAFGTTKSLWQALSSNLTLCVKEINYPTRNISFAAALKELRTNTTKTTVFADADYIDVQHFLTSLSDKCTELGASSSYLSSVDKQRVGSLKTAAQALLSSLKANVIVEKSCGAELSKACGLGIYFPKSYIHGSYPKTLFDKEINWSLFLQSYIEKTR